MNIRVKIFAAALRQLLGYVGCLSLDNHSCRGILVASDFDDSVVSALTNSPNINIVKYECAFEFGDVS